MASEETRGVAQSWAEEMAALSLRLKRRQLDIDVENTRLTPDWDQDQDTNVRWRRLRGERDRIRIIKTELGWLSVDAAARVDRRLRAAGDIIDGGIEGRVSEAALKLQQAEHIIQRAWWSRRWNQWPSPWKVPMWPVLSAMLLAALGATAWAIFHERLFPRGEELPLSEALFGATLWGFAGAAVNALRTVHHRVQGQEFEAERIAWYLLSPVIGLAFGAIAFLLFLVGLLSTGQDLEGEVAQASKQVDPTPILLLAVLAGLAQNAFLSGLQQIIRSRFRGAAEEEETSV